MKEKNKVPEIVSDAFYYKQEQASLPPKYAYLHLSKKNDEVFLAVFENLNVESPLVYWWEENDAEAEKKSQQLIKEFLQEAYTSLFIACGIKQPEDKPLWRTTCPTTNSLIPASWRETVKNINREQYGSRK